MGLKYCKVKRFIDPELREVKESRIRIQHPLEVVERLRETLVDIVAKEIHGAAPGYDLELRTLVVTLVDVLLDPPRPNVVYRSTAKRQESVHVWPNVLASFKGRKRADMRAVERNAGLCISAFPQGLDAVHGAQPQFLRIPEDGAHQRKPFGRVDLQFGGGKVNEIALPGAWGAFRMSKSANERLVALGCVDHPFVEAEKHA